MSVIMTGRVKGDPRKLEQFAGDERDRFRRVLERAKEHGLIAHRFYGSEDGQILVLDEWPDRQSFESFFEDQGSEIGPMFEAAGAAGEPEFSFWNKLETGDDFGWGA